MLEVLYNIINKYKFGGRPEPSLTLLTSVAPVYFGTERLGTEGVRPILFINFTNISCLLHNVYVYHFILRNVH